MNFDEFENLVPKIKNIELPAESSHFKMVPPSRKSFEQYPNKQLQQAKKAGVLALFYPNADKQMQVVFILRKTYKGVHSAQVSFPGGKPEPEDKNLEDTAVRETFEEVGVPLDDITVIKKLSQVYIPPSNFCVQPYIGFVAQQPIFIKQEKEVEQIIEVKLLDIINDDNIILKNIKTSYSVDIEAPAFKLNDFTIWGATAMILSEIKDIVKQLV